jgi:hypothetical protein
MRHLGGSEDHGGSMEDRPNQPRNGKCFLKKTHAQKKDHQKTTPNIQLGKVTLHDLMHPRISYET